MELLREEAIAVATVMRQNTRFALTSRVNLPHQSPLPQRPAIEIYTDRVNQALAKNIAQNIGTSTGFETWTDWQPLARIAEG